MKDRIKAVRTNAKLTQAAFADRVHVSRNYITQIEMGVMTPGDNLIRNICQEFGVNETWLRTGSGEMTASKTRQQEMSDLFGSLMFDKPESFRTALVTALLRFDPDGPEWEILERIYNSIAKEAEKAKGEAPPEQ